MDSRRDFLKKAALLGAGGSFAGAFPSIQRAFAIDPTPGTTWLDAEHVVILMQENRSFDHCFGSLRGVRGFDDPRIVALPNGNPVWLQSNRQGATYAPFRLDIQDTKATWMGSLPHSWVDQVDALNGGRHDGWLDAKPSGRREYANMPLTLGYYDRHDIPFYYAFADAFTVCDQNFCSSLTGTTPNRLHLWTGTIRARPSDSVKAHVRNEDTDYGAEASWTTFPERLEDAGVTWRIYQNEISLESGLKGEAEAWLANFSDNPIEWFTQYRVRFAAEHRRHIVEREQALPGEIALLEAEPESSSRDRKLNAARTQLESIRRERIQYTDAAFAALNPRERNLHTRAFSTNIGDPDYRRLTSLAYSDGGVERRMQIPKGDVLHQFRQDVQSGKLPTVSWIVAPENFSDHPSAPWYGAWYLSECLDILTKNPEVWRKTLFVLCYDENDGYFDHIPPFVPPDTARPETGKVSAGIDTTTEYVRMAQEDERVKSHPGSAKREGPIGLGFRVPLVIASPWSRGGYVNSEVCDHTSIVRMIENLVSHRTGKSVREQNISAWRRTVCGDLSSVFRPDNAQPTPFPKPLERDLFLGSIHQAQFRPIPGGFRKLSSDEISQARQSSTSVAWLPRQEPGTRPSCALPYELTVNGRLTADRAAFQLKFEAGNERFGARSAGAPFHVYVPGVNSLRSSGRGVSPNRAYAVAVGSHVEDDWKLHHFAQGRYHLRVHGPNGFFREFQGSAADPLLEISFQSGKTSTHETPFRFINHGSLPLTVTLEDAAYGRPLQTVTVAPTRQSVTSTIDLSATQGWHDVIVRVTGFDGFSQRFAGRIETGRDSISDPQMGRRPA